MWINFHSSSNKRGICTKFKYFQINTAFGYASNKTGSSSNVCSCQQIIGQKQQKHGSCSTPPSSWHTHRPRVPITTGVCPAWRGNDRKRCWWAALDLADDSDPPLLFQPSHRSNPPSHQRRFPPRIAVCALCGAAYIYHRQLPFSTALYIAVAELQASPHSSSKSIWPSSSFR